MKSEDLVLHSLKSISPIDGRHRVMTEILSDWLSEYSLIKYRIYLEVEYLIALSELKEFDAVRNFSQEEKDFLRNIVSNFNLKDAQVVQNIDRFGYKDMKATNHDFKAAEYFLKEKILSSSLKDVVEMVHFGLTTEDANNIAYNCMLRGALKNHYIPSLFELLDLLCVWADKEKKSVMLSKTHGQPATPTTFGKEIANYLDRLRKELVILNSIKLAGKLNGAVGNHNAQHFAAPEVNWIEFSKNFVEKLGFEANLMTTQIENHDSCARVFSSMIRINNILKDLSINMWLYISEGYLMQKKVAHEVGSSTMPHKINPWRMEVAEGSCAEANAKLYGFISKMQHSRLQRDLSDHEAQRAFGVGIAHSYLAVVHVIEEFGRLSVNREKMLENLRPMGSILTEAVQTLLRKEKYEKPYELMKDFSRGRHLSSKEVYQLVDGLNINSETKAKLKELKPETYLGLAPELVDLAVREWKTFRENYEVPLIAPKKIIIDYSVVKDYSELGEVVKELKDKGIEVIGVKVTNGMTELFDKTILVEEIEKSKDTVYVGQVGTLFNELNKEMLCVNVDEENVSKSEYNVISLFELINIVDFLGGQNE